MSLIKSAYYEGRLDEKKNSSCIFSMLLITNYFLFWIWWNLLMIAIFRVSCARPTMEHYPYDSNIFGFPVLGHQWNITFSRCKTNFCWSNSILLSENRLVLFLNAELLSEKKIDTRQSCFDRVLWLSENLSVHDAPINLSRSCYLIIDTATHRVFKNQSSSALCHFVAIQCNMEFSFALSNLCLCVTSGR